MTGQPLLAEVIRASAGTGKTHQLTNRYLRLLAAGVEPTTILGTTFTRKAAGEILDRVLQRLANAAHDAGQAAKLAEEIEAPGAGPCEFASLLSRLLRSLHGVRIGTLDSFYLSFASVFGLELGLPFGWSICEEADDQRLRDEALEQLLAQEPEEIGTLLAHLTKGESKRSIHAELTKAADNHYETYLGSEPSAWELLQTPVPVKEAQWDAALEALENFNFSACGQRFVDARDDDIGRFRAEDWPNFLTKGLAAKVSDGTGSYYKKPIPPEAVKLYQVLTRHAQAEIVRRLAEQTRATWRLLDRYHRELWNRKQATGRLRFQDVTYRLLQGFQSVSLPEQTLGFRLESAVDHLLLDEFQDTSLSQWRVLYPLAQAVIQPASTPRRSFFCVGDVKQAIYGWRGGLPEILQSLPNWLAPLDEKELVQSWRSASPIIDVVNDVFGNLSAFQAAAECQEGLAHWGGRFQRHTTALEKLPGHVCLHTGPAKTDGQKIDEQRDLHCDHVANWLRELLPLIPGRSVGVLCRRNEIVARMIYGLQQRGIAASEEGGNPLTDSPAVQVMLSLFTLADHPGHSIALYHLCHSPLQACFAPGSPDADRLAQDLRRDLLTEGYGPFTYRWAQRLAPACDRRDLSRLQQLVEAAYAYQPRSTLRADDFVAWIGQQRVPDPANAAVRVMTIHGAKGLEFDVVVLPELDWRLSGQRPKLVVGRDPKSLEVNFVCRYADENAQALLGSLAVEAFARDRRQRVEESLSLLYVALTRAVHALHLFIPGPRDGKTDRKDAAYHLLRTTLAAGADWNENATLFEHGDADWFQHHNVANRTADSPTPSAPESVQFATGTARRRGLNHMAPSRREGGGRIILQRLFQPSEGTGTALGSLYHQWFAMIGWLDDGLPSDATLIAEARKLTELPKEIWRQLDRHLAQFHAWLQLPAIRGVLSRSAYRSPQARGFPTTLASIWSETLTPQEPERERSFVVRDGDTLLGGSLDRVVWLTMGDRRVAADILDFKTDALRDSQAVHERTKHYRPQLDAYRTAVARLGGLDPAHVATRLIFTGTGQVQEVLCS